MISFKHAYFRNFSSLILLALFFWLNDMHPIHSELHLLSLDRLVFFFFLFRLLLDSSNRKVKSD